MLKTIFFSLISILAMHILQAAEIKNETGRKVEISFGVKWKPGRNKPGVITKKIEPGKTVSIDDLAYGDDGYSQINSINNIQPTGSPGISWQVPRDNYVLRLSDDKKSIQLLESDYPMIQVDLKK